MWPCRGLRGACVIAGLWLGDPTSARAGGADPLRLGGIVPQGPATTGVTALHHNPAMLGGMRSSAFHASLDGTLGHDTWRRNAIDARTGEPTGGLGPAATLVNGGVHYFLGASFYFDPIAVGVGIYDLGSDFRTDSTTALRYHLAPARGRPCLRVGDACPPRSGAIRYRHDVTFALAYDGGVFQLGIGVHLPMVRERFAFDEDSALSAASSEQSACTRNEDPACAERVGFKGWTQWIPRGGNPPGFDAALSFGGAVELAGGNVTLGARYRTFPLRRAGEVALSGIALVCRPDPTSADGASAVAGCSSAQPIRASLRERLPQELAVGGSFVLGRARLWRVDLNLFWRDLCQGGALRDRCPHSQGQTLRLVGLDRRAFVLPELRRYSGAQDVYGIDAWASYRARSRATVVLGAHGSTAAVRSSASTPANPGGARLGLSAGARIRVRERGRSRAALLLVPGYAIDLALPHRIRPSHAAFSPSAAADFVASGGDINSPGAAAVLAGRARPSNAGSAFGMLHTFSLAVLWGDAHAE